MAFSSTDIRNSFASDVRAQRDVLKGNRHMTTHRGQRVRELKPWDPRNVDETPIVHATSTRRMSIRNGERVWSF